MLELLLKTLKTFDNVEYLIQETKTHKVEGYNIKKQSEMSREVASTLISLTLYVTFAEEKKKYRGSYNVNIHPGTSQEELKEIISQGIYAAGFVKNAYYPLVSPTPSKPVSTKTIDTTKALADLQAVFHACDTNPVGHLSFSEFFITRSDIRRINSNGVDVTYTTYQVFVETAVHWPSPSGKEIEIYEAYRFSLDNVDTASDYLQNRIQELFTVAEKKAIAKPTPSVEDINILLSGECLSTFFSYYKDCANARMIYQELSTFKEGTRVQGADNSDLLTLTLEPLMEGSAYSRPYDEHGQPLEDHIVIKDGKLLKYWGDTRFSSYLDITPTGNIHNIHITGGTATDADLRKGPYLELVSFSDFQANAITGDFGSEIRLGFYFDGNNITPVTGGSISGNMNKIQDGLKMSAQTRQYNSYLGPATVCIKGASISGVEN
ncbi:MAG: metallopeptidase TldD-related protein [Defluviitaleaceae bacterium]|nr:metallopeptidase TldD-related protein [Defluviitaleaceae bacterium]